MSGPSQACPNEFVPYQAQLEFGSLGSDLTWDFDAFVDSDGDGNPGNDVEGSGTDVSQFFVEPGYHTIRVTAVDVNGCTGYEDKLVLIRTPPTPAFRVENQGCGVFAARFTDESEGVPPSMIRPMCQVVPPA